jgi:hypothetical protein
MLFGRFSDAYPDNPPAKDNCEALDIARNFSDLKDERNGGAALWSRRLRSANSTGNQWTEKWRREGRR